MKIVRHRTADGPTLAIQLDEETIADLPRGLELAALLATDGLIHDVGDQARRSGKRRSLADARLMAPLDPPTFRDFSTFPEHLVGGLKLLDPKAELPPEFYEIPTFYFSNPYAITGPYDDVPVPPGCKLFDYELEVAAVVGRAGQNLTVKEAEHHIAGYVVLNDFSARDVQFHEMRLHLGPAKGKDTATALGPVFVTADELQPYRAGPSFDLEMQVWVNDQLLGRDRLRNMAWSFAALAAYASRGTVIRPGDLLGSGTCQGGCLAELWGRHGWGHHPPLQPGDVVTTKVEGLGGTRNRIVAGPPSHPIHPHGYQNVEPLKETS